MQSNKWQHVTTRVLYAPVNSWGQRQTFLTVLLLCCACARKKSKENQEQEKRERRQMQNNEKKAIKTR
jgi:hypothetical protein